MEFIVAIDGPAGSGKSTVAKLLASELNFVYLDTGAMYRIITLKALREGIAFENSKEMENLLENSNIDMKDNKFYLDLEDVGDKIRTPEINQNVSKVASLSVVRDKLVGIQRKASKGKKAILDGRDIGSVVFPNAELKIFLTATVEERAKRRQKDYLEQGKEILLKDIIEEIESRDKMDSERSVGPLLKVDDAIEIDTTKYGIEEIKDKIKKYLIEKMN